MRRFELLSLIILAAVACSASAVAGYSNAGLAAFGCFYTFPIGGAKCANVDGTGPFWIGFYDTLGLFSIPWTLALIFFLISNRRRAQ